MNWQQLFAEGALDTGAGMARANVLANQLERAVAADQRKRTMEDALLKIRQEANAIDQAKLDWEKNKPTKPFQLSNAWEILTTKDQTDPLYQIALDSVKADIFKTKHTGEKDPNAITAANLNSYRGQAWDDAGTSLRAEFKTEPSMFEQIKNYEATSEGKPTPYPPGKAPTFAQQGARADSLMISQRLGLPLDRVRVGEQTNDYLFDVLAGRVPAKQAAPGTITQGQNELTADEQSLYKTGQTMDLDWDKIQADYPTLRVGMVRKMLGK